MWTPFAELVHHESASRGDDQVTQEKRRRSSQEIINLQNRWNLRSYDDPYYNRNLTVSSEQYWFGITKNASLFTNEKDLDSSGKLYDSGKAYRKLFKNLSKLKGEEETTFQIVGGKSKDLGTKSLLILKEFGLKDNDILVDVGCGYGR